MDAGDVLSSDAVILKPIKDSESNGRLLAVFDMDINEWVLISMVDGTIEETFKTFGELFLAKRGEYKMYINRDI